MSILGDLIVSRGGSVNPASFPDEEFELYSIPAHDRGGPELVRGAAIGSSKQIVEPGDVLISKIIPHIRRARVVSRRTARRQIASGEWIVFRGDSFHPSYLKHFLLSDSFHQQFMNTVAGVGGSLVRARPQLVKTIPVPLPHLDEQRRIAAILDQADALRVKRRQALAHLDDLSLSLFHSLFGSIGDPRWERLPLGDVVGAIDGGTSPNCESRAARDEEVGILKLGAVTYGVFRAYENKAYLGEIGLMRLNEVRSGDVLMTRKNTRELVGAVALVDEVRPNLLLPDLIFRLALNESRLDRRYFQALMMNPGKRPSVRDLSSGSAASMPNISKARLRQLVLEIPPIGLQREFATREGQINLQRAMMQKCIEKESELFSSLQHRAFRGDL